MKKLPCREPINIRRQRKKLCLHETRDLSISWYPLPMPWPLGIPASDDWVKCYRHRLKVWFSDCAQGNLSTLYCVHWCVIQTPRRCFSAFTVFFSRRQAAAVLSVPLLWQSAAAAFELVRPLHIIDVGIAWYNFCRFMWRGVCKSEQ
jgi:hypothetical protein